MRVPVRSSLNSTRPGRGALLAVVFAVLVGGWVVAYRADSSQTETAAEATPEEALALAARSQDGAPEGRAQQLEQAASAALRPGVLADAGPEDGVKAKTLPDPAAPTTEVPTTAAWTVPCAAKVRLRM